jgi:hypothetical protein
LGDDILDSLRIDDDDDECSIDFKFDVEDEGDDCFGRVLR